MANLIPNKQQRSDINDAYCLLRLTDNSYSLISFIDYLKVSKFNWYKDSYNRVYSKIKDRSVFLSRFILGPKNSEIVDHIDGNALDNRRHNLRITDRLGNARNHGLNKNNTSGYKGVSSDKSKKDRWRSYIVVNKKQIWLGSFSSKKEAARSYNEAAKKYFGEFARLNDV